MSDSRKAMCLVSSRFNDILLLSTRTTLSLTKLKGFWDELATYSDAPQGAQVEQQKLMQFLMGLNKTYSAIQSQILLMNPLPSVQHAYSLVT